MRRSVIRGFVERCLGLEGAKVEPQGDDLWRVTLPAGEGGQPTERWLAFSPQARRTRPDAELMTIGSAFLDHLVGQVRAAGTYAIAYRAAPARSRPTGSPAGLPAIDGLQWGAPVAAYRPLFLFVYLVEYHTIDVPDDVVLIAFDPARREALPSAAPLLETLRHGAREAPAGWTPLVALPTRADLRGSIDILDRRLQRRARRVKEASASEIARETANIEAYYRQLIAEARHPIGRAQLTSDEEAGRIRLLQLDWKRRVQEVSGFWEARGDVRLSALGVVMEPAWVLPLQRVGGRSRRSRLGRAYAVVAGPKGGVIEPRCAVCGERLREKAAIKGSDLVCAAHLRDAETPADAKGRK
jgi:hypothetical protein